MSVGRFLQQAAAGNAGEAVYVDDVFSTYLYTGNGSTQTITNGIDLEGEGGLVWIKSRDNSTFANSPNVITDTVTGLGNYLITNQTTQQQSWSSDAPVATSSGFTLPVNSQVPYTNYLTGSDYASWTFRKQPGFFDVVTYTGDGVAGREIAHNLGSAPGMMIVKSTSDASGWAVYHRSLGATEAIRLDSTGASFTASNYWNDTEPTDSVFTLGTAQNANGIGFVAYLFAHDAQDFGTGSDESIIKCGSFTANAGTVVDLGFEPQWVAVKASSDTGDWYMFDTMRGWGADQGSNDQWLSANTSDAEFSNTNSLGLTPTGFTSFSAAGATYIYVAIRRPHKPAEEFAATDLFEAFEDRTNIANQINGTMGPVDMTMQTQVPTPVSSFHFTVIDRLRDQKYVLTNSTNAELNASVLFDTNEGVENEVWFTNGGLGYNFKRAPGFFDVVAYTGTGVSGRTVTHNLNAVPELMLVKCRSDGANWAVYDKVSGGTKFMVLNSTDAASVGSNRWNDTNPTDSVFTVGDSSHVNSSVRTYIAYLFATVPGISKVGSYSGTGSNVDVDCGFTSGARFVLVKRTDSTGDWYVWDYIRGIVTGNDPYLLFNSADAEVTSTDYIDPLSSGFTITSSSPAALNASGGTYIFLAIA